MEDTSRLVRAARYRAQAAECRHNAETAPSPEWRASLTKWAAEWETLADETDQALPASSYVSEENSGPKNGGAPPTSEKDESDHAGAEAKAWRKRIDMLFAVDVRAACDILAAHGVTLEQAKSAIVRTAAFGAVNDYARDAAAEFRDPTNPCHYAAHILQLEQFIADASSESLQVGRLWGRAAIGLRFPEIAKAMQGWWLSSHRGKGGRRPNDLTRTLEYILQTRPNTGRDEILNYLQSDESEDEFGRITDPKVHITSVEVDEIGEVFRYVDRGRKTHTIAFASLDRKLRDLRPK